MSCSENSAIQMMRLLRCASSMRFDDQQPPTTTKDDVMAKSSYPKVEIIEEGMREGMQIESADISVDEKLRLLDALSHTGLKTIVVGSFVSPKWTPQMAHVDEIVSRFPPGARGGGGGSFSRRGRERKRTQ